MSWQPVPVKPNPVPGAIAFDRYAIEVGPLKILVYQVGRGDRWFMACRSVCLTGQLLLSTDRTSAQLEAIIRVTTRLEELRQAALAAYEASPREGEP